MQSSLDKQRCITPGGESVHLVQLTDTHLCAEPGGTLLGMDTDRSLQLVIERVLREREHIDLVLATGDLSDRGSQPAYRRLQGYLQRISAPCSWLPGNHDNRQEMVAALGDGEELCVDIRAAGWQILMLDSQIPGQVGGGLGDAELSGLRSALERAAEAGLYTLICLHHQPLPIGSAWLDRQMVKDADAFWQVVDDFTGVRGVLWGHVHQEVEKRRGDVRLLASPSTCVQFAPGSVEFKADDRPPGYRWLELAPDGAIHSAVSRVTDATFTVDLESDGYE